MFTKGFNPTLVRFCPGQPDDAFPVRVAVSIPPWFDFAPGLCTVVRGQAPFQSHLGSILPEVRTLWEWRHERFQSHLGSILPQLFQSHNDAIAAEEYHRLIYLITGESDVGEIIWGKQLAERAQQDLLGQG